MLKPVLVFLERFGNVVGRTILTVIYFVAVGPVAIFYRAFADALVTKRTPQSTYRTWDAINETVEDARRQD